MKGYRTGSCRRCHHPVASGGNAHKTCPPKKKTPAEVAALDALAEKIRLAKIIARARDDDRGLQPTRTSSRGW
jgi:hypothetical protein